MDRLPSKIPKLFSNLLLSSAPSRTDRAPRDDADFSAGMEKRAALPWVVHSPKSPRRKATKKSQAIEPAVNAKPRAFSSVISTSPSNETRRASLIPQPEKAQAATTLSNPTVSPKISSELHPGARRSAPKTEPLHDAAQLSRQRHQPRTRSPIHVQTPPKPTRSNSPPQITTSDRSKSRGSSPNPVGYPPSQKSRPQIGRKRNSGDSNSSIPSNVQGTGSSGVLSGAVLSRGVRQQQGMTRAADKLKESHSLDQSHNKPLQTVDAINSSNVRPVDPIRDAATPSSLLDSITSAFPVKRSTDSSITTGFSSAVDDVGHDPRGGERAPVHMHRDEDICICDQQSWQGDAHQAQLGIIGAHRRVDMTTSSVGERSKELNSRSKIPRSTPHSLGVARPLIVLDEDASLVPHGPKLEPNTFEPDRLEVPGVRSSAMKAQLGRDSIRLEEAERLRDANNGTSLEQEEVLSATLESLMKIHKPLDLGNEVFIPDRRKVAHGGIAIVYAGIWRDRQVAVKVLRARKSRSADWDASNERRLRREINVWAALKHRNIIEFLGHSAGFSDFPAMISHWCQRGTALEYLESQDLPVDERVTLVRWKGFVSTQIDVPQAQDVCGGLQYLHHLKIIHGDLKPSNVLVDSDYVAKLCDFGLVRLADWNGPHGMTTTSPYTGTERYKAPELFVSADNRHPRATFEGDIYSLGCLMVEFIEQIYPFQRFMKAHQLRRAIMDGYSPALRSETTLALNDMTDFFWNLLEACWGESPSRPPIDVIVDALGDFAKATPNPA